MYTSPGMDYLSGCSLAGEYKLIIYEDCMTRLKLKEHVINRDWCKGCGICVYFCPKQVLELDSDQKAVAARPEDCICCRLCELRCPDLAIEVLTYQGDKNE